MQIPLQSLPTLQKVNTVLSKSKCYCIPYLSVPKIVTLFLQLANRMGDRGWGGALGSLKVEALRQSLSVLLACLLVLSSLYLLQQQVEKLYLAIKNCFRVNFATPVCSHSLSTLQWISPTPMDLQMSKWHSCSLLYRGSSVQLLTSVFQISSLSIKDRGK